jgi:recombination protein RecA
MATRRTIVAGEATPAPIQKRGRKALSDAPMTPVARASKRLSVVVDEPHREHEAASSYFADTSQRRHDFVSSGCVLLDSALGGGWVLGRVANIVGDKSAGKTLLAIEACANFHRSYPTGKSRYAESESAFDESYAEALGMPVDLVQFNRDTPMRTVEDWYNDMVSFLEAREKDKRPGLYILDSFDALSDDAEMDREIDKGSFGQGKAKKSGELFRKLVDRIEASRVLLIVVSQIRDKLNVTFGETKTRSGGRALDFYCSHIVWIAEIGKLKKTIDKVERVIGVNVRANVKKNKVGLPFRMCDYPVIFGYGIDDLTASAEWLLSVGMEEALREDVGMSKAGYKQRITSLRDRGGAEAQDVRDKLNRLVVTKWMQIEQQFLPKGKKY